ncbi:MAG: rod-binding protein [Syntrophobacteraceae bacterium]
MISAINKTTMGAGAPSGSDIAKKRLKEACQEFEAVLTNSVFKSMRQSIMRTEEPDQARQIYESMMDETVAKEFSKREGCGLSNILYKQLLPLIRDEDKDSAQQTGSVGEDSLSGPDQDPPSAKVRFEGIG